MESLINYENRKKQELSDITKAWEYVRCCDRSRNKHVVRCISCGTEKKVSGFKNISTCSRCMRDAIKKQQEQSKYKTCIVCGTVFKPQRKTALYCCPRCKQRAKDERHIDRVREKRKINKRLREARATENGKIDYSITLSKLMERDKCICKLCGKKVNEHDYDYIGDTFVAGNDYPSIDHIKPLSKGGKHQWDNVQLAHRQCNAIKSNKYTPHGAYGVKK